MRFIFDCPDEEALPKAYALVDEIKPFMEKVKKLEVPEGEKLSRRMMFKQILENIMVKYPKETSELFKKLWILEPEEQAPNTFRTMAVLFANEVAVDFFTYVLPSLLQLSKELMPLLK